MCIPVYRGALGFLPLRKPVHLVMGAPLDFSCKQPGSPTDEEVRSAHSSYMEALILGRCLSMTISKLLSRGAEASYRIGAVLAIQRHVLFSVQSLKEEALR